VRRPIGACGTVIDRGVDESEFAILAVLREGIVADGCVAGSSDSTRSRSTDRSACAIEDATSRILVDANNRSNELLRFPAETLLLGIDCSYPSRRGALRVQDRTSEIARESRSERRAWRGTLHSRVASRPDRRQRCDGQSCRALTAQMCVTDCSAVPRRSLQRWQPIRSQRRPPEPSGQPGDAGRSARRRIDAIGRFHRHDLTERRFPVNAHRLSRRTADADGLLVLAPMRSSARRTDGRRCSSSAVPIINQLAVAFGPITNSGGASPCAIPAGISM